jgi:hypothetical protein
MNPILIGAANGIQGVRSYTFQTPTYEPGDTLVAILTFAGGGSSTNPPDDAWTSLDFGDGTSVTSTIFWKATGLDEPSSYTFYSATGSTAYMGILAQVRGGTGSIQSGGYTTNRNSPVRLQNFNSTGSPWLALGYVVASVVPVILATPSGWTTIDKSTNAPLSDFLFTLSGSDDSDQNEWDEVISGQTQWLADVVIIW